MSGLAAFTNQPGDHYLYDRFTGKASGTYYCGPINDVFYDELKRVEEAAKWDPTPGYAGCTDWFRRVKKFTINEPAISRRLVYGGICDGTNVVIDYSFPEFLNMQFDITGIDVDPPCGTGNGNAHDESITKALNNLTQHYAGIGADVAQARQTCSDFSSIVLRAAGFINAMKNGNWGLAIKNLSGGGWKDIKSAEKTLANLWLEFSYGWKPLASDLFEGWKLALDALEKPVPVMARGHGTYERSSHFDVDRGVADFEYKASWMTYLEANITNPWLHTASSSGLINPLSIAWEVVPFSFVLDWFIPIGATLQAITASVGLTFNAGWSSMKTDWTENIRRRVDEYAPGESFSAFVTPGHLQCKFYEFRRQCHTGFPLPKLYADVTPYSSPRALNALALVRQLLK